MNRSRYALMIAPIPYGICSAALKYATAGGNAAMYESALAKKLGTGIAFMIFAAVIVFMSA